MSNPHSSTTSRWERRGTSPRGNSRKHRTDSERRVFAFAPTPSRKPTAALRTPASLRNHHMRIQAVVLLVLSHLGFNLSLAVKLRRKDPYLRPLVVENCG